MSNHLRYIKKNIMVLVFEFFTFTFIVSRGIVVNTQQE